MSKESIPSIAKSGSDTFTVVPKTGLAAGTYKETVTVSGANGISESFDVKFTVNPVSSTYSIALDKSGTYDFGAETVGYAALTPVSVNVRNTGTEHTGNLTVALSGVNVSSFTLSEGALASTH